MEKLYEPGYILEENEFLLKIWDKYPSSPQYPKVGFLTKFTQKGEIPKAFKYWGISYHHQTEPPIQIVKENFRSGWKIYGYRPGKSQDWAELVHPDGYTIEIYLSNLFEIINTCIIQSGVIIGKFKWNNHKLIKE